MFVISIYKSCISISNVSGNKRWALLLISAFGHTHLHLKSFNLIASARTVYRSRVRRYSKKRSVSLASLTKPFPVNATTAESKLRMLIASTLSDSGWFWEFSGVRLKVFIQDLRGIMHLIVQVHAVVGTIQQYPRIWMLITSTTKQVIHILVPS